MERSKAIGSVVGISLGLITMPLLGPFSAFVAGFSALMTANALERTQRPKTDDKRDVEDDEKPPESNDLPLINQYLPSSFPNNLNVPRYPQLIKLPDIPMLRIPSMHDLNLSRPVNTKSQRRKKKVMRIDKYGRIIDPTD